MTATDQPAPSALARLLEQAQLAFVGRSEAVPSSLPGLARISVIELVKAPPVLSRLTGQDIELTVVDHLEAGVVRGFLTEAVSLGDHVSATEIGRVTRTELTAAAASTSPRADRRAGTVVVGRVLSVEDAGLSPGVTEHDPQWAVARVAVDRVETGGVEGPVVDVLFPRSHDTAWADSPKLAPDQVATLTIESARGLLADAAPYVLVSAQP